MVGAVLAADDLVVGAASVGRGEEALAVQHTVRDPGDLAGLIRDLGGLIRIAVHLPVDRGADRGRGPVGVERSKVSRTPASPVMIQQEKL